MTFGVVPEGFNLKRLPDILAEMEQDEQDLFGAVDVSAESVFGQMNGVIGNQCAEAWEQIENSYFAASPASAEGIPLDYNVALNGIERNEALPTVVEVGMRGTLGTDIPADTQVKNSITNELFQLRTLTTITNYLQLKLIVQVIAVQDSQTYSIDINGTVYPIVTPGSGNTVDSIALQLVNQILTDGARQVEPTQLANGAISLVTNNGTFTALLTANLDYSTIGIFESINYGEILAVANTINIIETPVSGLAEVNNFIDGVEGRDTQTDVELRDEQAESTQVAGGGTLPAIVAAIGEVSGVVTVKGFENRTDVTDGAGRPPHSIEIVVDGGANQDIADKLWEVKGGGINTFGNTSQSTVDGNGDLQTMYWSRPTIIDIYAQCTIDLYDEEVFPVDGLAQVQQKIFDYGNSLEIGKDVIPQRFHGSIFEVPGIENIALDITKVTPPPYYSSIIPIEDDERARFQLINILVSIGV